MFILKRQDVEIKTIQHPNRDQQIPILNYQGQSFRLMKVFTAQQSDEARAFWRDLTDNRGKACVLLEEPDRYSVWGKVRPDQLVGDGVSSSDNKQSALIQACLLVLQAVYFDVEDLLGARQAGSFEKDLTQIFHKAKLPQTETPEAVKTLLKKDPLDDLQVPPWHEDHLKTLLEELYQLAKQYFGNTSFAEGIDEVLEEMNGDDRAYFISWLNQSSVGKLWAIG
ncbi:Npun_F0813 family protein [Capilliphycus salinus ALCB114379]|uniref:Npun_F0813 family protein n=1 Tax=Capilliphycus salinus TaxID=2768948 RepID=UPI0039A65F13